MAEKRKAGRPPKGSTAPAAKRTSGRHQPKPATPEVDTPMTDAEEVVEVPDEEENEKKPTPLPNRVYESRHLPTISEPQDTKALDDDEYQTMPASAVLLPSLERSRQRWVSGEFFEKYWVRTANRKDAKNAGQLPPNNPQKAWMKDAGHCIFIVEPLMFEVSLFYSKEPAIVAAAFAPPPQQAAYGTPVAPSPYGTPYRPQLPGQQTPSQPQQVNLQPRALPPQTQALHPLTPSISSPAPITPKPVAPVLAPVVTPVQPEPRAVPVAPSTAASTTNKAAPDPVIQLLATRASTDKDLKELMKVVATGKADPDQLRRFQRHIDELNALIQRQNAQAQQAPVQQPQAQPTPPPPPMPQHTPIQQVPMPQAQMQPPQPRHQTPVQKRQQVIPKYPVILEFNGIGASPDRYLFPPYSIVEPLGSNSVLASFLVFRKGSDVADKTLVDPEAEYYEPVTVKIDVEPDQRAALEYIKRSVKPQEEVRKYMEDKMETCKRAPIRYLPLRLPHESQIAEGDEPVEEPPAPEPKRKYNIKKERVTEPAVEDSPKPEAVADGPGRRRSVKKSVRIAEMTET